MYVINRYWYTGESSSSAFSDFIVDVTDIPDPPQVISISYSISEHFLTFYEILVFDIEAKKLLVQGSTILAAAGNIFFDIYQ